MTYVAVRVALCVLIGSFAMPALAGPQVQPQPEVQPQPWTPKPFALFPAPKPPDRPLGTKALPLFPQKGPDGRLLAPAAVTGWWFLPRPKANVFPTRQPSPHSLNPA